MFRGECQEIFEDCPKELNLDAFCSLQSQTNKAIDSNLFAAVSRIRLALNPHRIDTLRARLGSANATNTAAVPCALCPLLSLLLLLVFDSVKSTFSSAQCFQRGPKRDPDEESL